MKLTMDRVKKATLPPPSQGGSAFEINHSYDNYDSGKSSFYDQITDANGKVTKTVPVHRVLMDIFGARNRKFKVIWRGKAIGNWR